MKLKGQAYRFFHDLRKKKHRTINIPAILDRGLDISHDRLQMLKNQKILVFPLSLENYENNPRFDKIV